MGKKIVESKDSLCSISEMAYSVGYKEPFIRFKYLSFFRLYFTKALQYRGAALAGVFMQFSWGFMQLLMYRSFYLSGNGDLPMEYTSLASYIWLQQALVCLFMISLIENDTFTAIINGDIAYELCRPINLYYMWFTRNLANRIARTLLRCFPIIMIAFFMPRPFKMNAPYNLTALIWFLISTLLGTLVVVAFGMLIYIATFYTLSPIGVKIVAIAILDFFSGSVVPLPFLPDQLRKIVELLPFAAMPNTPLLIYSGYISQNEIFFKTFLQLFWLAILTLLGHLLLRKALRQVVVQGG